MSSSTLMGLLAVKNRYKVTKPIPAKTLSTEKIQLPILGNNHSITLRIKNVLGTKIVQNGAPEDIKAGNSKIEKISVVRETIRLGFQNVERGVSFSVTKKSASKKLLYSVLLLSN